EKSLSGRDFGVGIRVFHQLQSIYSYTCDHSKEGLIKAAKHAAAALAEKQRFYTPPLISETIPPIHHIIEKPRSVKQKRKVNVMKKAYDVAKNYNDVIKQVNVHYGDEEQHVLIANSEGKFIEDERVRGRLEITAIASDGIE